MIDVIIVGGGPAGLSAALVLARACRSIVVIDNGNPLNSPARRMHGYLSRDGINPRRLLQIGRKQLERYGADLLDGEVVEARRLKTGFSVRTGSGQRFRSRKLLLTTGVRDELPQLKGFREFYGTSVHHCPYCDGWEWRDRKLVAYGGGKAGAGMALLLRGWSRVVTVVTDGEKPPPAYERKQLEQHGIVLRTTKIDRLEGRNSRLRNILFVDGTSLQCDAMFFNTGQRQKSSLAATLGCEFDRHGGVVVDRRERTCVPGLYLAGDASGDMQFVIQAAAEGAMAAVTINKEFQEEEGRTFGVIGHRRTVRR